MSTEPAKSPSSLPSRTSKGGYPSGTFAGSPSATPKGSASSSSSHASSFLSMNRPPLDLNKLDCSVMLMSGLLEKKSPSVLRGWQVREFRLYAAQILYSVVKKWQPTTHQCIPLDMIRSVDLGDAGTQGHFSIQTERKTYRLKADTRVLAEHWSAAIKTAVMDLFKSQLGKKKSDKVGKRKSDGKQRPGGSISLRVSKPKAHIQIDEDANDVFTWQVSVIDSLEDDDEESEESSEEEFEKEGTDTLQLQQTMAQNTQLNKGTLENQQKAMQMKLDAPARQKDEGTSESEEDSSEDGTDEAPPSPPTSLSQRRSL